MDELDVVDRAMWHERRATEKHIAKYLRLVAENIEGTVNAADTLELCADTIEAKGYRDD